MKESKISLILDSGAYSAWVKKVDINIEEYIQFCLDNLSYLDYIVNLDVIPGEWGQKSPSQEERERSASLGYKNYYYMIDRGIPKDKLIHVFHQGEEWAWLIRMVKEIPYIGLSPANDRTTDEKRVWLDQCMDFVTDKTGMPLVKFHGFGVTSFDLMLRYPWFSVDSTSWVLTGRFGSVFVPLRRKNKSVYNEQPWKVCVSNRSPSNKEEGKHITTFVEMEQEVIFSYFEEKGFKLGRSEIRQESSKYSLKENEKWSGKEENGKRAVEVIIELGLCNDYKQRDELNIIYFTDLEKNLPQWPWAWKRKGTNPFQFKRSL